MTFDRNALAALKRKVDDIGRAAIAGNRSAVGKDALILQGEIRKTLSTPGRGRVYKSKGITSRLARKGTKKRSMQEHRASAPGDPPAPDTGQLRAGVAIQAEGETALRVGPTAVYAAALEYGTLGGGAKSRGTRFRKGPALNRKRLAATLRGANAFSLARSVSSRGGGRGIAPRPYMARSLERARPLMLQSHISEVRTAILVAARA